MKNLKIVNLKAIAIILVVLGHSIIIYSPLWGYYQSNNKVYFFEELKNIINLIQMPLFFSISGYLLYETYKKSKNVKKFIHKKGKRLLIPFLLVGILWMIPIKMLINYPYYDNLNIYQTIIIFLLGTDTGHLWYLPALFIIFIIYIIINKIINLKNTKLSHDVIMFLIILIISVIASKKYYHPYVNNPIIYFPYFYLGFIINKYNKVLMKINKIIMIIIIIIIFILNLLVNNPIYNMLATIIIVIGMYIVIPNKTNVLISKISENSFGIYLFHSPLIYITFTYFADANPIIVLFLNFVVFGLFAFYITEFIRRIKFRIVIGE